MLANIIVIIKRESKSTREGNHTEEDAKERAREYPANQSIQVSLRSATLFSALPTDKTIEILQATISKVRLI